MKTKYFKNIIECPKYRNEAIFRWRIKITVLTGKSLSVQRGLQREVPHHLKSRLDRTSETPKYYRKEALTDKEMSWII